MWAELKDIMEEDFGLLLETYVTDAVVRLASINDAIGVEDALALREAAHSFKGSCGNIGALRLANLAANLEQQAPSANWAAAQALHAQMEVEYAQLLLLIQQELPALN
jgi:HPt (histidine-containing phosphotransfer) domain-containing protein